MVTISFPVRTTFGIVVYPEPTLVIVNPITEPSVGGIADGLIASTVAVAIAPEPRKLPEFTNVTVGGVKYPEPPSVIT